MADFKAILPFDDIVINITCISLFDPQSMNMKDFIELDRYFIDIIEANNFQQYHTDVMDWIFDIDSLIKKKSKFIVKKEFNVINSFKRRFNHQKLTIISQINLISTCSSSLIS